MTGIAFRWRCTLCALGLMAAPACGNGEGGTTDAASGLDAKVETVGDTQVSDAADAKADLAPDAAPVDGDTAADLASDTAAQGPLLARPLKFDDDLLAVWGTGPGDAWLVGRKGRILHWNGKTLAPRLSGTGKDLHAVWGRGPADVHAVGAGVVLHWDGAVWKDVTPDKPKDAVYHAVHASGEPGAPVWIGGDAGVVLRSNQDGSFDQQATNSTLAILALRALGPGQVWAVGANGQALKLAGGTWSATAIPNANTRTLRALAAAPSGKLFTGGDGGFLAATDKGIWGATPANDPEKRDLFALSATADTGAWAAGSKGILLHLNGKWNVVPIAGTYMKLATVRGLWVRADKDGKNAFGLGVGDKGAGIVLQGGESADKSEKWLDFPAEVAADLRAVAALDSGELVACGDGGLLLQAQDVDAPLLDLAAPVSAADLRDVAATGKTVVAVGAGGVAVRLQDKVFAVETVPAKGDGMLNGVARLGDGWLAVGDGGLAAVRSAAAWPDSQAWTVEATGTAVTLRSVAVADGVAYAVGDGGTVLRRGPDGKWTPETTGDARALNEVVAWSKDDAAAVGEGGVLLLRSASGWKLGFEASQALFLDGLVRRPDGTLVAVGYAGAIVVGKPNVGFQFVDGKVGNRLFGVAATTKGTLAVGMKGGVFKLQEDLP